MESAKLSVKENELEGRTHMDQIKIGGFIAARRKEKQMTQTQLAETLHVSVNAVSKWERGLNLPDYSKRIFAAASYRFYLSKLWYLRMAGYCRYRGRAGAGEICDKTHGRL